MRNKRSGGTSVDGPWRKGLYLPRTESRIEPPSSDQLLADSLAKVNAATAQERFPQDAAQGR